MPIDPYEDLIFADGPSRSGIWYVGRLSKQAFASAVNDISWAVGKGDWVTADDVGYQWWPVYRHGFTLEVFVTCLKKGR